MSYSTVRTGGSIVDRSADIRGLSTDTKPTAALGFDVPHGSTYFCMDTSEKYMYDKNTDIWHYIRTNGGGGGGDNDDYSIVETASALPSDLTMDDRKMYYVIDDGLFYLWNGTEWQPQSTKVTASYTSLNENLALI